MTFIGGGVFDANSWPPLPAKLIVDDQASPVTRNLPADFCLAYQRMVSLEAQPSG